MEQLDIALQYAEHGIKVFPCKNDKSKKPLCNKGWKSATTDIKTIKRWWKKNKDALIGSPNDQFTILDIDDYDLCTTGKILTDYVKQRLEEEGLTENCIRVKTLSGGTHLYFQKTTLKRKQNILPNIDLLANGGYTILPDQKNYVVDEEDTPWRLFNNLPELKQKTLIKLGWEFEQPAREAKRLKKEYRNEVKILQEDTDVLDYETGEILPKKGFGLYESRNNQFEKADPTESLLNEDGKLEIEKGFLEGQDVNILFHNREIQKKLGDFLRLDVPNSINEKTSMRSVLPGHLDFNPSMGVRWNEKGTHLIVRDFSNHFSDKYEYVDYNVVRLYATQCYKKPISKLSPQEFIVWFFRMLYEADILDLSTIKQSFCEDINNEKYSIRKVGDGLITLDAIKRLYSGYDEIFVFSDKFASAWCGLAQSSVNKAKRTLEQKGFILHKGDHDCSNGQREDGFFKTKLFSIVTENIAKEEKMVQKQTKDDNHIYTMTTLPVDQSTYQKLVYFAEDFDIPNIPMRKNMFFELGGRKGVHNPTQNQNDVTYYMDDLELNVTDSMTGDRQILLLVGHSPALERLYYEKMRDVPGEETYNDEPLMGVVLSNDFDKENYDLEKMETKLREYLEGVLSFREITTRYEKEDDIFEYILDGMDPNEDD